MEHEMQRCRDAFARFEHFGGRDVMGDCSRANVRRCHDAYVDFLRHLYKFYVGCFRRDRPNVRSLKAEELDLLFMDVVTRYLARRVDAIRGGYAPTWENHVSYYQVTAPSEFAAQFRRIRNAHSHVSTRRIKSTSDWTLTEFYERGHRFVMVLFQDAWSWGRVDQTTDLGNVDSFTVARRHTAGG